MGPIIGGVYEGLRSIPTAIYRSIKDDFIFPSRPTTYEEYLHFKVKGQFSIIRSQEGKITYLYGQIRVNNHEINGLKQLLAQRDKELYTQRKVIQSLEWQLREEKDKNRRLR
jgi:hypothetical protein